MKRLLILGLVTASTAAFALDFTERVAAAKARAATNEGSQYEATLYARYGEAMRACIPPGSTDPSNLGGFSLVADVKASGSLDAVEVQPRTRISVCFAERLKSMTFDAPPNARSGAYPIHVEMQVNP